MTRSHEGEFLRTPLDMRVAELRQQVKTLIWMMMMTLVFEVCIVGALIYLWSQI